MIGNDSLTQAGALFFQCFLYFQYFGRINGMFYPYVLYVAYPLVNGVGCSEG